MWSALEIPTEHSAIEYEDRQADHGPARQGTGRGVAAFLEKRPPLHELSAGAARSPIVSNAQSARQDDGHQAGERPRGEPPPATNSTASAATAAAARSSRSHPSVRGRDVPGEVERDRPPHRRDALHH